MVNIQAEVLEQKLYFHRRKLLYIYRKIHIWIYPLNIRQNMKGDDKYADRPYLWNAG